MGIPPEAITPKSDLNDRDLQPFCDSLDTWDIIFRIEQRLGVHIPNRLLSQVPGPPAEPSFGRMVKEFVRLMTDPSRATRLTVLLEATHDGRWAAKIVELPHLRACARTPETAVATVKGRAARVLARRNKLATFVVAKPIAFSASPEEHK